LGDKNLENYRVISLKQSFKRIIKISKSAKLKLRQTKRQSNNNKLIVLVDKKVAG
jgi:hypothetical protein